MNAMIAAPEVAVGSAPGSIGAAGQPTGRSAIVTRGLTKHYGPVVALDGLDLDVPVGSVFGLLGPNGAGKTTTLRLLTGLARPTAGSATVAGIAVGRGDGRLERSIAYLDQDPRFYGWMRGRELLELVGELYGLRGQPLSTRIEEVLEIAGLGGAADRRIGGYSGGMHQRIGLAAALLHRPEVLFLDEPVSALDPTGRHGILEVIGRLRGQTTVVMSTHILNDVERVCDRVGILDHGRLVAEGPIDELLDRFARPVYQVEPDAGQDVAVDALVERLRLESWVTSATVQHGVVRVIVREPKTAGHALLAALAASGMGVAMFERQRPNLEDVFLQLVTPARGAQPPDAGTKERRMDDQGHPEDEQ